MCFSLALTLWTLHNPGAAEKTRRKSWRHLYIWCKWSVDTAETVLRVTFIVVGIYIYICIFFSKELLIQNWFKTYPKKDMFFWLSHCICRNSRSLSQINIWVWVVYTLVRDWNSFELTEPNVLSRLLESVWLYFFCPMICLVHWRQHRKLTFYYIVFPSFNLTCLLKKNNKHPYVCWVKLTTNLFFKMHKTIWTVLHYDQVCDSQIIKNFKKYIFLLMYSFLKH